MKNLFIVIFIISSLVISSNSFLVQDTENVGKKVFDKTCTACHSGGFKGWMTGAPKIGNWDDWKPYFKDGLSVMTKHINEGTERHEIKGDCVDCTKEQIQAAIEYIMSKTKNENIK